MGRPRLWRMWANVRHWRDAYFVDMEWVPKGYEPTEADFMRLIDDVKSIAEGRPPWVMMDEDTAERLGLLPFEPPEPWRP